MKIKDTEISKGFDIPISTLSDWKKRENENWRSRLYNYLKNTFNNNSSLIKTNSTSYRSFVMASQHYAFNKLLGSFNDEEREKLKVFFCNQNSLDYRNYDEKELEKIKINFLEFLKNEESEDFKRKSLGLLSDLDINSLIIIKAYFSR